MTPSLFVNIRFTHTVPETPSYVGGKPAPLRPSPLPYTTLAANFYSWLLALQFEFPYWPCLPSLDAAKPHISRISARATNTQTGPRSCAQRRYTTRSARAPPGSGTRSCARPAATRTPRTPPPSPLPPPLQLRLRPAPGTGCATAWRCTSSSCWRTSTRGGSRGSRCRRPGDRVWMRQHMTEFERRAEEGGQDGGAS
ncbi:uncharacterized protein K441DRAFT_153658 [Cenococcum geophilum 1.58]|uniref:uncharacterized protein n=1 Tax=Cenococcum geophilum 1.58 TaxID=794803 RepID=UPI00358FD610|nr:hypothetical protein K441DRAFT_153658 [Cenococcum geophilum 1.58]